MDDSSTNDDTASKPIKDNPQVPENKAALPPSVNMSASNTYISNSTFYSAAGNVTTHIGQEKELINEVREIADWLTPINFKSIHNDTFKKRTLGTGVRFLQSNEFQRWLSTSCETLWVTGMPGAGKTILSSIVVDYLQIRHSSSPEVAVIISYCRYNTPYSMEDILSSFIKQLLERHPSVFTEVQSFYRAHYKQDATRPNRRELSELFQNLCSTFEAVYLTIDALDEVSDDTKGDILGLVASFSRANVFLTSRPLDAFEYLLPEARFLHLDPRGDIEVFILNKLETPRLKGILKGDEGLIRETLEKLKIKSEGIFLVVSLQIEMLKGANSLKKLRVILESLPAGVNDMYSSTVVRIESGDDCSLAMRALLWLTYAIRPLTITELQHALAISNDAGTFDLEDVTERSWLLSVCCGLVVVDQETETVRLAHYTAHDFLKALTTGIFTRPHTFITECCMAYLSEIKLFGQISYQSQLSNVLYSNKSYPLLLYVYNHWGIHAQSCHRENGLPTAVSAFFLTCGLYPWHDPTVRYESTFDRFELPHIASCYGLSDLLPQILLFHNKPTAEGRLPLHLCAMYGQDRIMKALLETHPKALNIKDKYGDTALTLACCNNHESTVKLLISYDNIDINLPAGSGNTPLMLAVENGNLVITQLLIEHPCLNPNHRGGQCWSTALVLASQDGNKEIVRLLLHRDGIDVNSSDWCGMSALARAAYGGHASIVELLVARDDIDPNKLDFGDETPLHLAGGHVATVKALLSCRRVNVNHKGPLEQSALIKASYDGHIDVVKLLLNQDDIDVNQVDSSNRTALVRALMNSKGLPIAELLLSFHGINVNTQATKSGETALLQAASFSGCAGSEHFFKMLISRRELDVNQQNRSGRTALILLSLAVRGGSQANMVKLLLSRHDIEVNKQDIGGNTALIYASSRGNVKVVKLLLSCGDVDVNIRNKDGDNALVNAAIEHREAIIELLLTCKNLDARQRGSFREFAAARTATIQAEIEKRASMARFSQHWKYSSQLSSRNGHPSRIF
ncbi:hypothetical protein GALMADRAFT_146939 [Galerina marginata CBS 339.88]|uniref:Uncharacterized protein n=1 Tax=Galerina marginata (strain CBS 339.88) TaxID=685588 RepID=A0A067SCE0_GALM3|nr:hypothetical protein GALMADRAFT_146939 [Galerina marginata CBS 339.88]